MKRQSGVTLISLIIYIIVLTITLSILAVISKDFFESQEYINDNTKYVAEMDKFAMYFVKDVKNNTTAVVTDNNRIIFRDGTTYTYVKEKGEIYRGKVKICSSIAYCFFEYKVLETQEINKNIITVNLMPEGAKYIKSNIDYVLRYW